MLHLSVMCLFNCRILETVFQMVPRDVYQSHPKMTFIVRRRSKEVENINTTSKRFFVTLMGWAEKCEYRSKLRLAKVDETCRSDLNKI